MIKRSLFTIILAIAAIVAKADSEGLWNTYSLFTDRVDNIVEASDKVYYRSGSRLFSYSPSDGETYAYLWNNRLSDIFVKEIYYNAHGKYLLVVYENSNIDLIYDDGTVVNLPEIKDSSIKDKTINNVDFSTDHRIVLATVFGYVIYNDETYDVEYSASLGRSLDYASVLGDNIVIVTQDTDNTLGLFMAPISSHPNTMARFTEIGDKISGIDGMNAGGDNWLVFLDKGEKRYYARQIDLDEHTVINNVWSGCYNSKGAMRTCKDGWYAYSDSEIFFWDSEDGFSSKAIPAEVQKMNIALYSDHTKIWTCNKDGIARHDISSPEATTLVARMKPADAVNVPKIAMMQWNPSGTRLWLGSASWLNMRSTACLDPSNENNGQPQYMNSISGDVIKDETVVDATHTGDAGFYFQKQNGDKRMYGGTYWMAADPDDDEVYYQITQYSGIFAVKGTHQIYVEKNVPVDGKAKFIRRRGFNIDPQGNLWVSGFWMNGDNAVFDFFVLPSEKRKEIVAGNGKNVLFSDWKAMGHNDFGMNVHDQVFIFSKKYNYLYYIDNGYAMGFKVLDHKGTYTDPSDDKKVSCKNLVDQDGNRHAPYQSRHLAEDADGALWIATNAGVYVVDDPRQCFTNSFRIRRPKVARNDGTNYADYLLDTETVNYIAVDPANRKWFATENSGLYLTNAEGTEILEHFTTENSPLPSNTIYSIECDPHGNTVYVGTTSGLMSFSSDATPPASDFSNVLAYPNPVRPEYNGYVTITGLKDNSLVKIGDSLGNIFFQTRSEGGMARWDACDASGRRVKSGVYYVFASSSESDGGSTSGAVTKIMVIN